jgi:hypothetical protein
MRVPFCLSFLLLLAHALGLMAGCTGQSTLKPVEVLDERTGLTLASLEQPIELVPSAQSANLSFGKRTTFAYLGPVEWNRMGTIGYGLWIHIAPGNDSPAGDIHSPGAVTLVLDDGPVALSVVEMPTLGHDPYPPVVSWGQTAYFDLTVDTLKKMAASQKMELDVRATDGNNTLQFFASHDTRAALAAYVHGRGITDD